MSFLQRLIHALFGRKAPVRPTAPSRPTATPSAPARTGKARRNRAQLPESVASLDPARFRPLTRTELGNELAGRGESAFEIFRSGGGLAWWGRRDLVPPTDDARTQLIDRGMVGMGVISQQALARIHAVGDEMLRLRPPIDPALLAGQQAVEADRRERAARKAQKKAEAEARKRAHAEAVAHRKATDIGFLGRGISRGLADRTSDASKLTGLGLPVLATPSDVASALGLQIRELRWLAFHSEATTRTHYVRFTVPKKSGGTRELAAPHRKLARAQHWILEQVLAKVPTHDAAHGFVKGRGTRTNAAPHLGADVLVNCDLEDFFGTITVHRVLGLFAELGYSPAVATIFALLCTEAPRRVVEYAGQLLHVATGPRCLPQGASTSPAISNLVTRRLDARFAGLARKLGFVYTRYADDLTFSATGEGSAKALLGYLLARVRHVTEDEGFRVNEKKTRVLRQSCSQRVTGIVVNSGVPTVPRATLRRLRAILHAAATTGLAAQNRDGHPDFAAWVRGMISYVHMVNPVQAAPLRAALARVSD